MTTAQEYLEEAASHEQEKVDSFDRSDTDGFLSQWAAGINAELARTRADLEENGKMAWFSCLMEDDRRVDAKHIPTRFGSAWILTEEEEARFGRKFIPFSGTGKSRVQKELGLHEQDEEAPAWAALKGTGTGLSGNVWVEVYRTDGK